MWGTNRFVNMRQSMALVVIGMLMVGMSFWPVYAFAAGGPGRITGRILDGTKQDVGMAGQVVTLQMEQGNSAQDVANVTTDARGGFAFAGLSTDKAISYALYARYEGAQYTSSLINLAGKAAQPVNLVVYEATSSATKLVIQRATVLLHAPDARKGTFAVSEVYTFYNLDTRTYVGSLSASAGMPNALRFSLPHTASNVSLGTGFNGYQAVQVSGGFASDVALAPGDTVMSFTFEAPFTTSDYDFDYAVQYPTVELTVLIPTEIHASSALLKSQGVITADAHVYQQLQGVGLRPTNGGLHVQLQGLPALTPHVSGGSTQISNVWWLLLILLCMVIIVGGTWYSYRRSTLKIVRSEQEKVPTKAGKAELDMDTAEPKQKALLQELLKLDQAYEAGKLTKAVYEDRRAQTKARLRTLMKKAVSTQERGKSSPYHETV